MYRLRAKGGGGSWWWGGWVYAQAQRTGKQPTNTDEQGTRNAHRSNGK
jgi:hypothetical protein